jgi:uncharacterized protein (DUF983 family)
MKLKFKCPNCGHEETFSVVAVGWKKIRRQCTACGAVVAHQYRQSWSVAVFALEVFASIGVALLGYVGIGYSSNVALTVFFVSLIGLAGYVGSRVVNAFSDWRLVERVVPDKNSCNS